MTATLPPLFQRFAGRPGGLGRAYVHKTAAGTPCLALVSKASKPEGVDPKKMCATFVVTSDDPDRVDDVVVSKGLVLTHFRTNPVGLYGHGQMILPIGKWEDPKGALCVWPRGEKTTGTLYFSQKTEHAAQVFALVEEGILRACSVGFNPLEEPESRGRGFRFTKTDLLEISIVAIPAQPTATLVRQVLSRNTLAGSKICEPVRKGLVPLAEGKPVWSNGADLPGDEPMSKKWKKTAPAPKVKQPMAGSNGTGGGYAVPAGTGGEEKDALQDCVSAKIPKLIDEGYSQDQAAAIAYAVCGEGKSLEEAKAAAMAPNDVSKQIDRLEALTERVLAATARVKAEPPPPHQEPKHPPTGPGEMPDQQQDEGGPPEAGEGRADPKEVLSRLVDALADYIDLTTKPAPTQAPPGMEDEEEDDDGEEDDMDLDGSQEDQDEEQGMDRYQFRATAPEHTKGVVELCPECVAKLCKGCKQMVVGEDENAPADEVPGGGLPETTKGLDLEDLDESAILAALRPVHERVAAVKNAWQAMQGTMP